MREACGGVPFQDPLLPVTLRPGLNLRTPTPRISRELDDVPAVEGGRDDLVDLLARDPPATVARVGPDVDDEDVRVLPDGASDERGRVPGGGAVEGEDDLLAVRDDPARVRDCVPRSPGEPGLRLPGPLSEPVAAEGGLPHRPHGRPERVREEEVPDCRIADRPCLLVVESASLRGGVLAEEEARVLTRAAVLDELPHHRFRSVGRGGDCQGQGAAVASRPRWSRPPRRAR